MSILTDTINNLLPGQLYYLFYVKVNTGFLNSANIATNARFQRIQRLPMMDQYPVQLGTNGTPPVNFFGSAGKVEKPEAFSLVDYYNSIAANNIDSWLLTITGAILWKKSDGLQSAPFDIALSYVDDFLPEMNPSNLKPIVVPI